MWNSHQVCSSRRFVIEQRSKSRPIDDGLEAQLNSAYTSTIRLDLQDADHVVALTLELGKSHELNWLRKTLDLSKAYKQLPVLPEHRDLAVVFFKDSRGNSRYYIPNALFVSTGAVNAFNRVSRSLWFLINKFLKVPSAVYFDDYPMFSLKASAQETDSLCVGFLGSPRVEAWSNRSQGKALGFFLWCLRADNAPVRLEGN